MRLILFLFFIVILVSCESTQKFKSEDNNKKQKKILMKITTEPNVKIKK